MMHRRIFKLTRTHLLTWDDGKQIKTKILELLFKHFFHHLSRQHAFAGIKTGFTDPKLRFPRPFWPICGLKNWQTASRSWWRAITTSKPVEKTTEAAGFEPINRYDTTFPDTFFKSGPGFGQGPNILPWRFSNKISFPWEVEVRKRDLTAAADSIRGSGRGWLLVTWPLHRAVYSFGRSGCLGWSWSEGLKQAEIEWWGSAAPRADAARCVASPGADPGRAFATAHCLNPIDCGKFDWITKPFFFTFFFFFFFCWTSFLNFWLQP